MAFGFDAFYKVFFLRLIGLFRQFWNWGFQLEGACVLVPLHSSTVQEVWYSNTYQTYQRRDGAASRPPKSIG